jgi:hypothetical protein
LKALSEIAALRDPDAFDTAIDIAGSWPRDERREAAKIMLRALVERRIGRRDQANAWIWRLAEYTREVHEEYAVQRWPETKRLLGLLVNSAGGAHARNARRLVHASRKQDRRLAAALLAAALAHTPEAEEVLRGARTRMARKPPALARELLRNFPKRRPRGTRRRRKGPRPGEGVPAVEGAKPTPPKAEGSQDAASAQTAQAAQKAQGRQGTRGRQAQRSRPRKSPNGKVTGTGASRDGGQAGKGAEISSDIVLTEALSGESSAQAGMGGELEPGSGKKLQRNVEEALERANESPAWSDGRGGS